MENEKKTDVPVEEYVDTEATGDVWEVKDVELFSPDPAKEARRPGEWPFLILIFAITVALLTESFKLPGLVNGQLSSPSSIPQLILLSMVVMIAIVAVALVLDSVRDRKAAGSDTAKPDPWPWLKHKLQLMGSYLICTEIVILLTAVLVYAILLPYLHFEITTFLFLAASMYLLERKNPVKKLIISACVLAALVLIFGFIMKVVLP